MSLYRRGSRGTEQYLAQSSTWLRTRSLISELAVLQSLTQDAWHFVSTQLRIAVVPVSIITATITPGPSQLLGS